MTEPLSAADATQEDVVRWCFDSEDHPEWWEDLHATRDALVDVLTSINSQFTAQNAALDVATMERLDPAEYRRIRAEHADWRRRAVHVKTAVEERLREVKAAMAEQRPMPGPRALSPEKMLDHVRWLHGALGEFLRTYDTPAGEP